jgi:predicted amidohydrolase YtcJ
VLIRDVDLDGQRTSVRVAGTKVESIDTGLEPFADEAIVDGHGGALLPGLHDHHIHLLAMAAVAESIVVGPPAVQTPEQFDAVLRAAAGREWIRAVGYDESVAGDLDRDSLDAIVRDTPVRVQHRSGHQWTLNSAALRTTGIDAPDGRLYGADELLRARLPRTPPPSLADVGHTLTSYGITGVTDMTASDDLSTIEWIAAEARTGALPQSVVVTGSHALAKASPINGVEWGPVKFVIADHALPSLDEVIQAIDDAHTAARSIAIHCVTAAAVAVALAAWDTVGAARGDRIEHGSVISPGAAERVAAHGLTVVTQPAFIATRGDDYARDVDAIDRPDLYRGATLLAHGIPVGGSSDAPFGPADPWLAIATAATRRTESGATLGAHECMSAARALDLYLTSPDEPGGAPRRVTIGTTADLCVVDRPVRDLLANPAATRVRTTVIRGQVRFRAARRG